MGEQKYPPYHIVLEEAEGSIEEKKSRFIAVVRPVADESSALLFLEQMRKKYWNASHHCFAYVLAGPPETVRFGDDGEPGGTAGRPMLDVLQAGQLKNVAVVVIRYFGGTLLGTGGLVRAYTQAVQEGLANAGLAVMRYGTLLHIETDYGGIGKIQYLLAQEGYTPQNAEYAQTVRMQVMTPLEQVERLCKKLTEATDGRAKITRGDSQYFIDKESGV